MTPSPRQRVFSSNQGGEGGLGFRVEGFFWGGLQLFFLCFMGLAFMFVAIAAMILGSGLVQGSKRDC